MENIFFEITLIICLAAVLSVIFKLLKQPVILAYILTGIIIGPFGQLQLASNNLLQVMGEFGITLLLFMLGLEIRIKDFKEIGKTVILGGAIQIILTFLIAFFVSTRLGFSNISSFYLGLGLAFSSTIIVVKLLSDNRDLNSLYGRIAVGFLLIQDLVAILALIFLTGFNPVNSDTVSFPIGDFVFIILKAVILFTVIIYLSKKIFPKIIDRVAKSPETLFLFSIAWVFGLASIVSSPLVGFSVEIGGLLAGLSLASSIENYQIVARVKALRDFFVTIFFIFLGMKMAFVDFSKIFLPAIYFSLIVLFIKPLIIMVILGATGYRKRTSFLVGLNLAQVSEFSLIIAFLGNKLGHISNDIVSLLALIVIITFTVSTYTITNSFPLYRLLQKYLKYFERKGSRKEQESELAIEGLKDHVVLVGAKRTGQSILDAIEDNGDKVVVVDFDPDVVKKMKNKKINSFFGDISDLEIQERANFAGAKLVISTVDDVDDNLFLIKGLNSANRKAKIIVSATDFFDAKKLYKAGADYVVLPHLAGGRHIAKILTENRLDKISSYKEKDLAYLK